MLGLSDDSRLTHSNASKVARVTTKIKKMCLSLFLLPHNEVFGVYHQILSFNTVIVEEKSIVRIGYACKKVRDAFTQASCATLRPAVGGE